MAMGTRLRGTAWREVLLLVAAASAGAYGQAYKHTYEGIEVGGIDHWRNWIYQNDIVEQRSAAIDSSGLFHLRARGIAPRFHERKRNYTTDMDQFEYADGVRQGGNIVHGGITALANAHQADLLVDGVADSF